jgi:hypothetical protein
MTYNYKDRPWEPVAGRAGGYVLVSIANLLPRRSGDRCPKRMLDDVGCQRGPGRAGSYLAKQQQGSSKTGLAGPASAVIKQICPTVYTSRLGQL